MSPTRSAATAPNHITHSTCNTTISNGNTTQQHPKVDGKAISKLKEQKYKFKQQQKLKSKQKEESRNDFLQTHKSFVTWVTIDDVNQLNEWKTNDKGKQTRKDYDETSFPNVMDDGCDPKNGNNEYSQYHEKSKKRKRLDENNHNKINENNDNHSSNKNKNESQQEDETCRKLNQLIGPFLNMKDQNIINESQNDNNNDTSKPGRKLFIAEGTETVRLMIERCRGSSYSSNSLTERDIQQQHSNDNNEVVSILTKPTTFFEDPVNLLQSMKKSFPSYFEQIDKERKFRMNGDHVDAGNKSDITGSQKQKQHQTISQQQQHTIPFHVIIASEKVLSKIAGFHIGRGALGLGCVPHYDENWLYSYVKSRTTTAAAAITSKQSDQNLSCKHVSCNMRILALDQISDTANLGSLIRSSAAFGMDCIILSHDSCDAWYRRSVRVSMGHVLTIPIVRVSDLACTIDTMQKELNVTSYAAVIDHDADLVLEDVEKGQIDKFWCCVLGNEGNGISSKVSRACKYRIRIGMSETVDSLSIGVAGGILLHNIREREA